jgi:cysteine desulfurase
MSSEINLPIYMDYASTTPVDPRVAKKIADHLTLDGNFGNPASRSHKFGWKAEEAVEEARSHVANLVNCDPREIVWTSGATEADNLAIKGIANFYQKNGKHIITSKIEHKAVLDPCRQLERDGFEVTYLEPNEGGLITPEAILNAIREDTVLISIMHINNELGTINDLNGIGKIAREKGIFFHVDAAQSTGKIDIDLSSLPVDLMSFSAHKTYGPKGIGALFVRRKPRVRIEAQIHGGGHERGMRSGTLPTHQIVGMGEAFRIAKEEMDNDKIRIQSLHDKFYDSISKIEEIYVNGDTDNKVNNILNISFALC